MTQRPRGSDLSHTETTAKLVKESVDTESLRSQEWCLDGFKSFSATDGSLSVTLDRPRWDPVPSRFSSSHRGPPSPHPRQKHTV
ncbi:hypothetical protein BS47DRAFT_426665 [Hydnum rufescens UP504]|uniref:Uncharacterized protein n=1 Tax=Hydnum rufescens UP504 TaxID=1448309 RepID=A0A9P6E0F4_9AGAM|nr:hypothetical protein BS47DRAFT_426665 [Hydnum rufescens UP504]